MVLDDNDEECFVDFIGNRDCTDPEACDIETSLTTDCNDDGSFNVNVNIQEGTSLYDITFYDGWQGDVLDIVEGVASGTITTYEGIFK